MANKLVSVDENLHLPVAVRNQLKADVESDVSASVTAAQTAATNASLSATAAADARDEAVAAAEFVTAPSDAQVAAYVGGTGGATRAALDGRYATLDALADFEAQAASIEDLMVSVSLFPRGHTLSGTDSSPVLIAPFPLRVTSVALTFWQNTDIATSDTNYWTVEVRKGDPDGVTHTTIATRTTKSTGGVSWLRRVPWVFDTNLFDEPEVDAGQTLNIAFYTTGTPTGIGGPIVATVGYEPL